LKEATMFSFLKRKNGSRARTDDSHDSHGSNVRLGKPETTPTAPAHVAGVKQGNARGNSRDEKGLRDAPGGDGDRGAYATARRSTGINPEARDPIDPRMPNLPPA
jgi:hypothetical protein